MVNMPRKAKRKKRGVLKNGWDLMPKDTLKDQVKEHFPLYIQDSSMYVSIHDIKLALISKDHKLTSLQLDRLSKILSYN